MKYFCANCGQRLTLIRKAVPSKGIIINLIQCHKCPDELPADIKFDFDQPTEPAMEGMDQCVQSLNALKQPSHAPSFTKQNAEEGRRSFSGVGTDNLRDRRFDTGTKSTAPSTVLEQIKAMSNSIPSNELSEIPKGMRNDETDSIEMGD
jgi:hypothetical protein